MLPSYLRHMRYESRSRRQQRPCQSLPPECLRSWTRVQLRRHAGGKDLRCFLGVCCCRRPYVLICWSYIAGSCCFSPSPSFLCAVNKYIQQKSVTFLYFYMPFVSSLFAAGDVNVPSGEERGETDVFAGQLCGWLIWKYRADFQAYRGNEKAEPVSVRIRIQTRCQASPVCARKMLEHCLLMPKRLLKNGQKSNKLLIKLQKLLSKFLHIVI